MKKIESYSKTIEVTVETSEVFTFRRNREVVSTGREKREGETCDTDQDSEDNSRGANFSRTVAGEIEISVDPTQDCGVAEPS